VDDTSTLRRNDEMMSTPVDGDIVFLNPTTNNYVALDPVGRRIWELLEHPQTIADLTARLRQEFTGDADAITADVRAFVAELASEGLIRVGDAGA
jgi:hypothetical protein